MKVINDKELNETIEYLLNNRPKPYEYIHDDDEGGQYKVTVSVKTQGMTAEVLVDAIHSPAGKQCHAVYNDSTEAWIVSGDMYIPKLILHAALVKPKKEMDALIPKAKKD